MCRSSKDSASRARAKHDHGTNCTPTKICADVQVIPKLCFAREGDAHRQSEVAEHLHICTDLEAGLR